MNFDSHLVNYIYKVIEDTNEESITISNRINDVYNFKNKMDMKVNVMKN